MPPETDSEDERTGFETSAELRRDDSGQSPYRPSAKDLPPPGGPSPRTWIGWIGWAIVVLVLAAVGFGIYFLVSSL
jgi:hypothetical protein